MSGEKAEKVIEPVRGSLEHQTGTLPHSHGTVVRSGQF